VITAVILLEMKLSEHPEYQTAVTAGLESKFKEARAAYLQLIAIAERENDIPAHSYLLQCLGDIEARDGNRRIGWRMHRQAIEYSPNIPFVLIMYAKSLANHFDRKKLAVEMLDQAEQLLDSHEWKQTDDNITAESYANQIANARVEIAG
jgi:predicted Zn-dependent protease